MTEDINRRMELFIGTLKMLPYDLSNLSEDEISDFLEELEGDYFSFFHEALLNDLLKENLIDEIQFRETKILRSLITGIDTKEWRPNDFRNNEKWIKARLLAEYICHRSHK